MNFGFAQHWVQLGAGNGFMEASDLVVDVDGKTLATGYFTSTANFGAFSETSYGNSDVFVCQIDENGSYQWLLTFGGIGTDRGNSIATDNVGNSYVTGFFNDSIQIGSFELVSEGAQDVFIAKISPTGTVLWANKLGGLQADIGTTIAQLSNGNIVVSGQFSGLVNFGSFGIQSINNSIDVFVIVLDSLDGSMVWSKTGGSKFDDTAVSVACDGLGNMNLTGMFSDTIKFDVLHPNTSNNNVYLIQFNATGTENWFRRIAGSTFVGVHALECTSSGNVYLTGDYIGTLSFFGSSPLSIAGVEFSKSFLSKYNSSGTLVWGEKLFSDNPISTTSLAIDSTENIWVGGYFECEFSQLQQFYDDGIFIARAGKDAFLSRFNASGTLSLAKHIPAKGDVSLKALALSDLNSPSVALSFSDTVFIPTSSSFGSANLGLWPSLGCNSNNGFCGDPNYGEFVSINTFTNNNFIIGNCVDPEREPFDFYLRNGSVCDRSKRPLVLLNGVDTAQVCDVNSPALIFDSLFCHSLLPFTFSSSSTPLGGGFFKYQVSSNNSTVSCSPSFSDSVVISAFGSSPSIPAISDNQGVNTNELTPNSIELCGFSNVILSATGTSQNSIEWKKNNTLISTDTFALADSTGSYQITISDSNGCEASNQVNVIFYDSLPSFIWKLELPDTIVMCENEVQSFSFLIYDSISNSLANVQCLGEFFPGTSISQYQVASTASTTPIVQQQSISCDAIGSLIVSDSGLIFLTIDIIIQNTCDTISVSLTDSVMVVINPSPPITIFNFNINGPQFLCPQDTIQLIGTGDTTFHWFGPNQMGTSDSIINVTEAGTYVISLFFSDTNSYGCSSTSFGTASYTVQEFEVPIINANQTLLCPGDSAILTANTMMVNPSYNWQGPNGNITINDSNITVGTFGDYYCVISNAECTLESNTISILQYTSPEIISSSGSVICNNESLSLYVDSVFASSVNWLPPLSGSNFANSVSVPGIFQCEIVACGITTIASFEVFADTNLVQISQASVLCEDSSTNIKVDSVFLSYEWSNGQTSQHSIIVSDSGFYAITVIDQNNCTYFDTLQVSIDQIFSAFTPGQDTVLCASDSVQLSALAGLQNLLWFPNLEMDQSIWVENAGFYSLKASDTNGCVSFSDTIAINVRDSELELSETDSILICEGESVELTVLNPPLADIIWSNGIPSEISIDLTEAGLYYASAIDSTGCGLWSDTISLNVIKKPLTPTISDTSICWGQSILFSDNDTNYLFLKELGSTQTLDSGITIRYEPNKLESSFLIWSQNGHCLSDLVSFDVMLANCDLEIPNVISPNHDGLNDYFEIENCPDSCFSLQIFNRWGTLVFESNSPNIKWDGHVSSSGVSSVGVYFYSLQYCSDSQHNKHGSFTLLR